MRYYKILAESWEAENGLEQAINNSILGIAAKEQTPNKDQGDDQLVHTILNGDGHQFETIYRSQNVISDGTDTFWGGKKPRIVELELVINASEEAIFNFQKYLAKASSELYLLVREAKTVTRATLTTRVSDDDQEKIGFYSKEINAMPLPQQGISEPQIENWNTSIEFESDFHCSATYTGNIPDILALQERIRAKAVAHNIDEDNYFSVVRFE